MIRDEKLAELPTFHFRERVASALPGYRFPTAINEFKSLISKNPSNFLPKASKSDIMGEFRIEKPPILKRTMWFDCTQDYLIDHIYGEHFDPVVLEGLGVPRFDTEVARYRGFDLTKLVTKLSIRLLVTSPDFDNRFAQDGLNAFRPLSYRDMIVLTLKYIEQTGAENISWDLINSAYPNAKNLVLDINEHSRDGGFDPINGKYNIFDGQRNLRKRGR